MQPRQCVGIQRNFLALQIDCGNGLQTVISYVSELRDKLALSLRSKNLN